MTQEVAEPVALRVKAALIGVNGDGQAEIVEDAVIRIEAGRITDVGPAVQVLSNYPGLRVESRTRLVAMPGLVNAHHHSGLTPLQLGVPFYPLELWLPRFMGMRYVDPRLDTLYSAIEMLESGTTTVHHIQGGTFGSAAEWSNPADAIIKAYREIGMRVSYSFMIRDQNQVTFESDDAFLASLPDDVATHFRPRLRASLAPIPELMRFFGEMKSRWSERAPDTVCLQLAPANLHWCSDDALVEIFATARAHNVKLHMHLDETFLQSQYAKRRTGRSAVAHLAELNCLGPTLTLGHGIWAGEADLDRLAEHHCSLCHNASSGLRLASGIAPINAARARGVRVALGIDQCGVNDDRDMLTEMRVAWMVHREPGLFRDRPSAAEIFRMATENGASTTGFEHRIGRLDVGKQADIVLIDWAAVAEPYLDSATPMIDALVHRAKTTSIREVYVAGTLVVENGKVSLIDRDAVLSEIRETLSTPRTADEIDAQQMTAKAMPFIEAYYRRHAPTAATGSYSFNSLR